MSLPESSEVVLITGCSSGIGRATALELARAGRRVFASARRPESLVELAAAGCRTLALDVDDEASMRAAVASIEAEHGAIGVLVHNAGYSQSGTIEEVPVERVRAQFETNLFGLLRLTQLALPAMRRAGRGRIVILGSMGGKLTFPGGGIYHATKHALEAIADALRFEVGGFGIDVTLVEPGLVRSGFAGVAVGSMSDLGAASSPYAELNTAVARLTTDSYEKGPLAKLSGTPDDVAHVIAQIVAARRPPARRRVTGSARLLVALRRWLPDRLWDAFLRSSYPQPRRAA